MAERGAHRRAGARAPLRWVVLLVLVVSAMGPTAAAADSLAERFQEANGHYYKNRFGQAKSLYLNLITDFHVRNPVVFYNLANTHYRLGELGRAVVNYKRALALEPEEDLEKAIRSNLDLTTEALVDRHRKEDVVEVLDETHGVAYSLFHLLPEGVGSIGFAVLWIIFFGALITRRMTENAGVRRGARVAAIVVVAPMLLLGIALVGRVLTAEAVERGVVVDRNVQLRDGKHRDATTSDIPEGLEVRILDASDPCDVRVQLSNGKEGWIPAAAVERIEAGPERPYAVADPNASCVAK